MAVSNFGVLELFGIGISASVGSIALLDPAVAGLMAMAAIAWGGAPFLRGLR